MAEPGRPPAGGNGKGKSHMMVLTGLALSIPWLLIAPILVGMWLDERFGTEPWITLGSFALALVATGFDIWVILKRVGMFE